MPQGVYMSQYDDFNHCETVYIANMVVNLCSAIGKALGNPQVPSSNTAGAFVFIDRSKFQKLIFSTNLNLFSVISKLNTC